MRRVTDDQLRMSLTIWIRLAPSWIKRDLLGRQKTSQEAERTLADYLVGKLRVSRHEVIAPEPITPFMATPLPPPEPPPPAPAD